VWWGHPVEGYYGTYWLTGLWSTQAKMEDIVLKAAWQWGSNSSVINNPLVEPSHTPLFAGLLSACKVTICDSPFSWESSITVNSERYERMNK